MNNNQAYIEVIDVSKTLRGKDVLNSISVAFSKGSIFGIIGPNASGKTMLFRTIAGLLVPTSGRVVFADKNARIGVIIENPGFMPQFTGYENLKLLADIRRLIGKNEIYQAMERVGLDPYDKRYVKTYSLGMRQRLAVAQAIMEQPEILILDEPTRGLDEDGIKLTHKVLLEQKANGATIILSSHNKEDITYLCEQTFVMSDGRLSRLSK